MWRAWILFFAISVPAFAHPLPTLRYDRTVTVTLSNAGVAVDYVVELSPWSMIRDPDYSMTAEDRVEIERSLPSQKVAERIYAKRKALILADRLNASANAQPMTFQLAQPP